MAFVTLCWSVRVSVCALKEKRLQLSTPNFGVHIYSMAGPRHASTLRSKGKGHRVMKCADRMGVTACFWLIYRFRVSTRTGAGRKPLSQCMCCFGLFTLETIRAGSQNRHLQLTTAMCGHIIYRLSTRSVESTFGLASIVSASGLCQLTIHIR